MIDGHHGDLSDHQRIKNHHDNEEDKKITKFKKVKKDFEKEDLILH